MNRMELTSLLPAAQCVLEIHAPGPDGLCQGCHETWARLVPYPCTQAKWATTVADRIPSPETLAVLGIPPEASVTERLRLPDHPRRDA